MQFFRFGVGVFQRRARRGLENPIDHPLVLERDEARGKMRVHEDDADDEGSNGRQREDGLRDDRAQECRKTKRHLFDAAVERFPHER